MTVVKWKGRCSLCDSLPGPESALKWYWNRWTSKDLLSYFSLSLHQCLLYSLLWSSDLGHKQHTGLSKLASSGGISFLYSDKCSGFSVVTRHAGSYAPQNLPFPIALANLNLFDITEYNAYVFAITISCLW